MSTSDVGTDAHSKAMRAWYDVKTVRVRRDRIHVYTTSA